MKAALMFIQNQGHKECKSTCACKNRGAKGQLLKEQKLHAHVEDRKILLLCDTCQARQEEIKERFKVKV